MKNGFDRLAAPYRWMEYLTFGRSLERCRCCFLGDLTGTRRALLLGDGDGRFAANLLRSAPLAHAHAIDGSAAMLAGLQRRCAAAGASDRITISQADLSQDVPPTDAGGFDLVTTHFFLDCLSEHQIDALALHVKPLLTLDARWVISEFNIPPGFLRVPARLLVWCLYAAFRLLAGLRVRRLPDHPSILQQHGFERAKLVSSLRGLLVSEVWVRANS